MMQIRAAMDNTSFKLQVWLDGGIFLDLALFAVNGFGSQPATTTIFAAMPRASTLLRICTERFTAA